MLGFVQKYGNLTVFRVIVNNKKRENTKKYVALLV
jgi:hypothetical protein